MSKMWAAKEKFNVSKWDNFQKKNSRSQIIGYYTYLSNDV